MSGVSGVFRSLCAVILVWPLLCPGQSLADARGNPSMIRGKGPSAFDRLPLSFEVNEGQVDGQVKFLSRGHGFTVFLTADEAVLVLRGSGKSAAKKAVIRMGLAGGIAGPVVSGLDELPGRMNYFRGNDPSKWRRGIRTYAKVLYKDVYHGIDLVFHGNRHQLEFDFVVSPGADPASIRLSFDGSSNGDESLGVPSGRGAGPEPFLRIDERGDLILNTAVGGIRFCRPAIYQDGEGSRQEVAGRYLLEGTGQVRFEVAKYDAARTLVIDPVVIADVAPPSGNPQKQSLRPGHESGEAIVVDENGAVYVTGVTVSDDFPTLPGALQPETGDLGGGFGDAFVAKLNANGTALLYSTHLGGSNRDGGTDIVIDAAGDAYVTGYTSSRDFPGTTEGTYGGGSSDAFVAKIRETEGGSETEEGLELVYSIYVGGGSTDTGHGIDVDDAHNVYIVGDTSSADFPTTEDVLRENSNLLSELRPDAFVVKVVPDGSGFEYATYLGGIGLDQGRDIVVDADNSAYVTGTTLSSDFATTSLTSQTKKRDSLDAFVAKINVSGTRLDYAVYLGGTNDDEGESIALDSFENAYVTGKTLSSDFPVTEDALQGSLGGDQDAFVVKINPAGSALVYATYLGGAESDEGRAIAVSGSGSAWITGITRSRQLATTETSEQTEYGGGDSDAFVARIEKSGARLAYLTYLGGRGQDEGLGITVDSAGLAYVTGLTYSSWDFAVTDGVVQPGIGGAPDAFVTKINAGGSGLLYSTYLGGRNLTNNEEIGCGSSPMTDSLTANRFSGSGGALLLLTLVAATLLCMGGKP